MLNKLFIHLHFGYNADQFPVMSEVWYQVIRRRNKSHSIDSCLWETDSNPNDPRKKEGKYTKEGLTNFMVLSLLTSREGRRRCFSIPSLERGQWPMGRTCRIRRQKTKSEKKGPFTCSSAQWACKAFKISFLLNVLISATGTEMKDVWGGKVGSASDH